jgi:hypothetical protein
VIAEREPLSDALEHRTFGRKHAAGLIVVRGAFRGLRAVTWRGNELGGIWWLGLRDSSGAVGDSQHSTNRKATGGRRCC